MRKGAIVAIDSHNPLASVIIFQYNPSTLQRTLQARTQTGDDGARAEALRLGGAPVETISLEVELDATDQLANRNPLAIGMGIYPQLSALEMLLYPKIRRVLQDEVLAKTGTLELIGPAAPFTVFAWGLKRIVPVRITDLSISEEAYDSLLNPIRARVGLSLRVLSYSDLEQTSPGHSMFLAYQMATEAMAALGSVTSLTNVLGVDTNLF